MFNRLVLILIGLGIMFGYTLNSILTDLATGVKSLASDVSTLIVAVISLVIILGIGWWERRR